jgi:beta-glucanase (GH16 family)
MTLISPTWNWIAVLMLILILFGCGNGDTKQASSSTFQLVWSDEFNYTGRPDSTKWGYDLGGGGWGNQELQYYTNHAENARVENERLVIEARKENRDGQNYTSARLLTKGRADWKYGKIEFRAKLPSGRGTWPALWLLAATDPLAWPDDGEIDVMEHVGSDQGRIHQTIHCKKYNHVAGTQKTATTMVPDCSDSFHVYSTEWSADSILMKIDGTTYFRFANEHTGKEAWPFDNKMYILINIAVGGSFGGQKGVDDTIFPQRMEVDYVRVYQLK